MEILQEKTSFAGTMIQTHNLLTELRHTLPYRALYSISTIHQFAPVGSNYFGVLKPLQKLWDFTPLNFQISDSEICGFTTRSNISSPKFGEL